MTDQEHASRIVSAVIELNAALFDAGKAGIRAEVEQDNVWPAVAPAGVSYRTMKITAVRRIVNLLDATP